MNKIVYYILYSDKELREIIKGAQEELRRRAISRENLEPVEIIKEEKEIKNLKGE